MLQRLSHIHQHEEESPRQGGSSRSALTIALQRVGFKPKQQSTKTRRPHRSLSEVLFPQSQSQNSLIGNDAGEKKTAMHHSTTEDYDQWRASLAILDMEEDDVRCNIENREHAQHVELEATYRATTEMVKKEHLWDGKTQHMTELQQRNMYIFLFRQMLNTTRQRFTFTFPNGVTPTCMGMSTVAGTAACLQLVDMSLTDDDIHSFAFSVLPGARISLANCPPDKRLAFHNFMGFKSTVPLFAGRVDEFRATICHQFADEEYMVPKDFELPLHALLNCAMLLLANPNFLQLTPGFYDEVLKLEEEYMGATLTDCTFSVEFERQSVVGKGGFGTVYKCLSKASGRPLALKVVALGNRHEDWRTEPAIRAEINMLKLLRHPSIIQYCGYCYNRDEHTIEILMEFAPSSLRKVANELNGMNETMLARDTIKMLEGLAYLHDQHVVHRDIKGSNVLMTDGGHVKLSDFGTAMLSKVDAKAFHGDGVEGTFKAGKLQGTPHYLAPEVINGTVPTEASDIWAVGCMMIELTGACDPWWETQNGNAGVSVSVNGVPEELPMEALLFHIGLSNEVPTLVPSVEKSASSEFKDFVSKCLQRDPCKRPTCRQLLEHPFVLERATATPLLQRANTSASVATSLSEDRSRSNTQPPSASAFEL